MLLFAAEEKATGIASLGLDLKTFLFQLITFVIIVFLLNKYALSKIFAVVDQRRAALEEGLKSAEAAKQAVADADDKVDEALRKARAESNEILAATNKEAASIIAEAEAKAARRAENIVKDAKADMGHQVQAAREALKDETRKLVAQATEQIIKQKLDASKDASLINGALQQAKDKA